MRRKAARVGDESTPLASLGRIVREAGLRLGLKAEAKSMAPRIAASGEQDPSAEFIRAMEGVSPVRWSEQGITSGHVPTQLRDTASEDRRLMEAATHGEAEMRLTDHPEYVEGWIGVAGRHYLPQLRGGLFSIQGQIDLHGLDREDARLAVEEFVERMSRFHACCVKIIHGRGINSGSERAVLKECLQRWLTTRRLAKHVVAYASASPRDGGVGALYVLLKPES